jgi:hypothetical protein
MPLKGKARRKHPRHQIRNLKKKELSAIKNIVV